MNQIEYCPNEITNFIHYCLLKEVLMVMLHLLYFYIQIAVVNDSNC